MRKAQCTNMHYFDADAYAVCPHCGAPERREEAAAPAPESAAGKSSPKFRMPFFGGHKNAGTCQIDNDKVDEALPDIIAELNKDCTPLGE